MTLQGKGFYIWKVRDCEGGDPNAILAMVKQADLSHVLIKVADRAKMYNYDYERQIDLVAPVSQLLQSQGIQVWGWQYIYGSDPIGEARMGAQRVKQLGLDGFVVNAEVEFKQAGKDIIARKYMTELRNALPDLPIALSSYRFPSYHPQFPFKEFLEQCDLNMPQVYWQGSHNPDAQIVKTVREFQGLTPFRPIIPTGAAYSQDGWAPTTDDETLFLQTCKTIGLAGANFWSWDYARNKLPALWDEIGAFPWPTGPAGKSVPELYIEALNENDVVKLATLYSPNAVHVNFKRTVVGNASILTWYHTFLTQTFPQAAFKLTGASGTGNSVHFTWEGASGVGGKKIMNGNDTFGIRDGKITYHYTFFSISEPIGGMKELG